MAATAALVRSHWPWMSAGDVINRLISTARDLGEPGRDAQFGFGLVDPVSALTNTVAPVGRNPLDDDKSPGIVGFGPAPGLASVPPAAARHPTPLGGALAPLARPRWEAQPAGQKAGTDPDELLGWAVLGGLLLVSCLLLATRQRSRRRAG